MSEQLQTVIDRAWEEREIVGPSTTGEVRDAALSEGEVLGAGADALRQARGQVRAGRGAVEEGLLGGGVVVGHGATLGTGLGPECA